MGGNMGDNTSDKEITVPRNPQNFREDFFEHLYFVPFGGDGDTFMDTPEFLSHSYLVSGDYVVYINGLPNKNVTLIIYEVNINWSYDCPQYDFLYSFDIKTNDSGRDSVLIHPDETHDLYEFVLVENGEVISQPAFSWFGDCQGKNN